MTFRQSPPRPGGRAKGTTNKATEEVRKLALRHGPAALAELARLSLEAGDERARVAASKEILDRAYGKTSQVLGDSNHNKIRVIIMGDDAKL